MEKLEINELLKLYIGTKDERAFEEIYKRSYSNVFGQLKKMLKNIEQTEEVTQIVFLKLFRKIHTFKFESSFASWLYRVAVNEANMYMRLNSKHERRKALQKEVNILQLTSNLFSANILYDYFLKKKLKETVLYLIKPEYKESLFSCHLPLAQVTKDQNSTIPTVKSRRIRAKNNLIKRLKETYDEYKEAI